jgi:hypothetical protein
VQWKLEVRDEGSPIKFKAAIARGQHLELVEAIAPYDKEFTASSLVALFDSTDGNLSVVAYSDASGIYSKQCSFSGGPSGRILFDARIPVYLAGSL